MRKGLFCLLAAVASLGFLSCDKDEDYAKDVAGSYPGTLTVYVSNPPVTSSNTITLARTGENKVKLVLPDFNFMGGNLGNIEVPDMIVGKAGNVYSLAGSTTLMLDLNSDGTAETPIPLTFTGTITDGAMSIAFPVTVSAESQINVTFAGTKQ